MFFCFFVQCQISECTRAIRLMIGNGHLPPPPHPNPTQPNPTQPKNISTWSELKSYIYDVVTKCNAFNYRAKLSWKQNERKKAKQSKAKQAVQADLHSESWFLLWIIPDQGWSEVPHSPIWWSIFNDSIDFFCRIIKG
jgi:hypothetical protein